MQYSGTKAKSRSKTSQTTSGNDNFISVINKWSNMIFYDCNLNIASPNISSNHYNDIYEFTVSAESLLRNNLYHTHMMLVIDIAAMNLMSGTSNCMNDHRFIHHVDTIIKSNIHHPNLYCRLNDETIVLMLANYSSIDVAMLVINMTENITNYNPEYKISLKFGTCEAEFSEHDAPSLYRRAYFAKSTIKDNDQQFMANYNELVFQKKVLC